ncbi:hypothetical protein PQX77_021445 [Marasmius sp. AFHP31]|nr:hypothetical protein PQX77_021445 [Marasmius sp. AFHP31]
MDPFAHAQFAINFPHQFQSCGTTIHLDRRARDPFAMLKEVETYINHWPVGFQRDEAVLELPTEGLPFRYKDNIEPYTISTFFDFTEDFFTNNGRLHHLETKLPVSTSNSFNKYKDHGRQITRTFLAGPRSAERFNNLVQDHAHTYFVDGLIYAHFWIDEILLPPISDLGLIGGLTFEEALALPRTIHTGSSAS